MKKTAVEFLFKELLILDKKMSIEEILQQAKEMEKQQIIDAYSDGVTGDSGSIDSEQYYNETFKNK